MTLHVPLAVPVNTRNPFGKDNPALNLRGSLSTDSHGPRYAYFGWASHVSFVKGYPHQGTDYPAPIGTDVYALAHSQVKAHAWDDARGRYILTWFRTKGAAGTKGGQIVVCEQHLSAFVKGSADVGDIVEAGQHIAESGASGAKVIGAHCHVEVRFTTSPTADWHYWQAWRAVNLLRILPGGDLATNPYFIPATP